MKKRVYADMSASQLKKIATRRQIPGRSGAKRKPELIELIEGFDRTITGIKGQNEGQILFMAIALYQDFLDKIAESAWLMDQAKKCLILETDLHEELIELPGGTATDYRRLCVSCVMFSREYRTPLAWAINETDRKVENYGGNYRALFLSMLCDQENALDFCDRPEKLPPPRSATLEGALS